MTQAIESSVRFLAQVNQVSDPTQTLRWWKRGKERPHYCWLWVWLSRKPSRNENTFERVIIPCSKFTINSDIQINWLWSQSNFIKVYIMDSKVFPFFRVSTRFNKSFVFLGYDYKHLKFFSRVLPHRFYAAPLSLLFALFPLPQQGRQLVSHKET